MRLRDGVPEVVRGPALVETSSGAAGSAGQTRKSRLGEIMWGQTLLAGPEARTAHPNPPASVTTGTGANAVTTTIPNHATLLNKAEKRLLAEWMDLGGQYFNDPFDAASGVRAVNTLSETVFTTQVQPILRANCSGCHAAGQNIARNRFVLTGSTEGDLNVTLTLISDVCNAPSNVLLSKPSTVPHPAGALTQINAILPASSADYNKIATWISSGC